ncbi:hypothetical protein D6C97_04478 [Aureobasidium pullulans]|uniref:Secreted protein n=1 Tax=Aureobasidium pullulans TaxID=5580 RepID=A0A4S8YB60_AURPU|nr:hypothetical protein D6D29_02297 [Aureobasidium pullulans]THW47750.1 hypothetical protein D6D22_02469 [Aureobasidium pullulans]THX50727.1 hypothetical protein D6D08_09832 [Aureobasidium pullulans]THY58231.1 hypothetical protein D6C97_04478 [Aureobasidium pullulans]TIA53922.1 hypothetical protein D6C79_01250 [Aureobasidium pullulans]
MDPQNPEKHSEAYAQPPAYYEQAPPLPPLPPLPPRTASTSSTLQPGGGQLSYPAPPQRLLSARSSTEDISSPVHYTRDPHKLVAYLVPFPKPKLHGIPPEAIPARFLIYTPPPPPLKSPKEGEKEAKVHKLQRKWQEEVRSAKTSTAKTASWQGVKSKATKAIDVAMGWTKSSNLEFINRINIEGDKGTDKHSQDVRPEDQETHRTVGLEEMVLIYPNSIKSSPDQLKIEFVQSMMRSKSKAQRDSVIATGLLPVSAAIDIMATLIWPFGGLLEIDAVWAAASIRGAKISRNVTKRLTSTSTTGKHDEDTLKLSFTPSPRLEVLDKYLGAKCHDKDAKTFPSFGAAPTETDCLQAIGWAPSQIGGDAKNWEDEHWETAEVKEDLKTVMTKAAREWEKWCKAYEKNPEKAVKK